MAESAAGDHAPSEEIEDRQEDCPASAQMPADSNARESAGGAGRLVGAVRVLAYAVLPASAMLLALAAGYLKWLDSSLHNDAVARTESVRAATEGTVAMLSYGPDTVQNQLDAASGRLTGPFLDSYRAFSENVVAPAAIQKLISAEATVPAAAAVTATPSHAVVLVFVNQSVIVGNDAPAKTTSRVRVTLEKIGDRWLISGFDPI